MTVEAATYINTLNSSYPEGSSPAAELDNHARLIKAALLATFPNITGPMTAVQADLNQLAGVTALTTTTAGQWVHMKTTTISGGPSAVDFVNGSGGVVISSAYDEYLLEFNGMTHGTSANSKLRLDFSNNGGSSWAAGSAYAGIIRGTGTTLTLASLTAAYVPVNGDQDNAAEATGFFAEVRLTRRAGTEKFGVYGRYFGATSNTVNGVVNGWLDASAGFNAIRVYWNSGSFGNTGEIKLFGRKA